jgi:charged multivesicular body protein 4
LFQIDGTLTTIEQQREALEGANTNTAVLQTMGEAAKALKKAHADMDVDQVNLFSLLEEIQINSYDLTCLLKVKLKSNHK